MYKTHKTSRYFPSTFRKLMGFLTHFTVFLYFSLKDFIMKNYSIVIQNTTDKRYFTSGFTDLEDSRIYYHVKEFVFPGGYAEGEYRFYVIPETDKEITADNNHIYVDGVETEPLSTGLMVLGSYRQPSQQYNKKETFIQYE